MSIKVIVLNGHEMKSIKHTHEYIAKAMEFPEYYGKNLDALADCLTSLGSDTYIVLYGVASMRQHLGKYSDNLVNVFESLSSNANSFTFILCD